MSSKIHEDDYDQIETDHSQSLYDIEHLSHAHFGMASDVLMRLQDKAYQLGIERGKKMASNEQEPKQ